MVRASRSGRGAEALAVAVVLAVGAACGGQQSPEQQAAQRAIDRYGCGACHTIPGIRAADGLVGPPLVRFAERAFIAGQLPNTPENLVRWITNPQEVEPGTAMPDLGVSEEEARSMATYLHSLE